MEDPKSFNKNISTIADDTFKISTITTCAKTENINLELLNKELLTFVDEFWNIKTIYDSKSKKTIQKSLNTKNGSIVISESQKIFYNCILIKLSSKSEQVLNISIKIFKNGSIIFTGAKNMEHINKIISFLTKLKIEVKNIKISMIKCDFKYPKIINQELVKNKINNDISNFKFATLNLSRYAGLNIKYNSQITIIMFKTGSIMITLKNTNELMQVYTDIIKLLQNINDVST